MALSRRCQAARSLDVTAAVNVQAFPFGRRSDAAVPRDRVPPRRRARRRARRRRSGGRVLRRVPPAQPFPGHLRRRRVQLGLCALLRARARDARGTAKPRLSRARSSRSCCSRRSSCSPWRWPSRPSSSACSRPASKTTRPRFGHAVLLTRITFPYLLCVTLVTLQAAPSTRTGCSPPRPSTPCMLNVVMVGFLAVALPVSRMPASRPASASPCPAWCNSS